MISLNKTFEDMKEEIGFERYLFDEVISPSENPEYFVDIDLANDLKWLNVFLFEKVLSGKGYFQSYLSFQELQFNSIQHGNNFDEELPIHLKIAYGNKGHAIQIEDCGEGFDLLKKLKLKEEGKKYFKNKGCGIKYFKSEKNVVISYENAGRVSNLMFKIN